MEDNRDGKGFGAMTDGISRHLLHPGDQLSGMTSYGHL